jgi:septal ring factor EnvC (AmiA/AmiB activator)
MPNGTIVIMIRHGEYISVYSNLSEYYVQKGEQVKTKDLLGMVYTSQSGGVTVLDFQLWKGAQKVDPQTWLMNK